VAEAKINERMRSRAALKSVIRVVTLSQQFARPMSGNALHFDLHPVRSISSPATWWEAWAASNQLMVTVYVDDRNSGACGNRACRLTTSLYAMAGRAVKGIVRSVPTQIIPL